MGINLSLHKHKGRTIDNRSVSIEQIQEFKYIGGRKFYDINVAPYVFPTDIEEVDRLHQQHFTLKHICRGNYTAPIHDIIRPGSKILDLGCGPGQWTLEIAQEFPFAQVYGIDISSNFPSSIKPLNSHFIVGDVTEGLPWEDNYFDFIWIRYLFAAIKDADWRNLYHEIKRVLKPGGILEHHECDGLTVTAGPKFKYIQKYLEAAFISRGLNLRLACQLSERIRMAGFEDIQPSYVSVTLGKQGGVIGKIWATNGKESYIAMKPWLAGFSRITDDEYESIIRYIFEYEIEEYNVHHNHHMVWARKMMQSS
ncbi:6396_t:CDS:2 [Ambispora leptoticha]|uniref:6396_t:CDS:1 n=1 Tax=Ambispora leptoticha TaxID=144679 RepID=A0A9N9A6S5_9GLOM|nr:6396_t:CDS:2 [Ambispora leptoticha]